MTEFTIKGIDPVPGNFNDITMQDGVTIERVIITQNKGWVIGEEHISVINLSQVVEYKASENQEGYTDECNKLQGLLEDFVKKQERKMDFPVICPEMYHHTGPSFGLSRTDNYNRPEYRSYHPHSRPIGTVKQGRNEPCSCGSGKKYKNCHGKPE